MKTPSRIQHSILIIVFAVVCVFGFSATSVFATSHETVVEPARYTPLVGIPGMEDVEFLNTEGYVEALYYLAITVAAILAVYQILFGGIRWMFDGIATHKEEAKSQIQGAVFGLLIVLSAVLVLETINVDLTNLNIFGNAPALSVAGGEGPTPVTYGTTLYNNPGDPAVLNLIAMCEGEVVTWGAGGGGGGKSGGGGANNAGSIGCFENVSTLTAVPGDTLTNAVYEQYDPNKEDAVAAQFRASCEENDGLMNMNECIPKLVDPDADIKIGDTLNLEDAYDVNAHDAVVIYQANCPGKVTADVPTHTISCVALDDNPADDLRELECQMINKVYNPVLENCF